MGAKAAVQDVRTWGIVIVTTLLAVGTYYLLPAGMNELARRAAAIFVVAAIFWATEVIPLYATSLLVLGFEIFFLAHDGGLAGQLPNVSAFPVSPTDPSEPVRLSFSLFLSSFASDVIILFLGGFLISAAMVKTGLDRAIAAKLLKPVADRPVGLVFAVMAITAFFSMWMSNTATAAMMLAIVSPFVRGSPSRHRYSTGLLLAVALGANLGGIGTPIGTPPNAVALASLRRAGFAINFLDWMLMAVPLAVLLLVLASTLLVVLFPAEKDMKLPDLDVPTRIGVAGWMTLAVLVIAVVLWLTEGLHGINTAVVALTAAAALATLRILDRQNINSIDWDILLLMWGGLSLGTAMQATGLVAYLASVPVEYLPGLLLAAIGVAVALMVSTFMSNTAAANLLIPMAMSIPPLAEEQVQLAMVVALACSFGMAMPISTPPNAIVFASGRVPVRAMMLVGTSMAIVSAIILLLGYQIVLPWVIEQVVPT